MRSISKMFRIAVLLMSAAIFPCHSFGNIAFAGLGVRDSTDNKEVNAPLVQLHDSIAKVLASVDSVSINDSIVKTTAVADTVSTTDSIIARIMEAVDSADFKGTLAEDSIAKRAKRDWNTWRPNAKRAMWLAIVIPGAGQIYNRKFWKLPIVYGGFLGCAYAIRWNNMMYRDYSQAYMDIMDNDPTTESYNQFLHLGATITDSNMSRYQTLFQKRKDYYRKYRDLSIFCLIGVYALSIIDAYVDASLSEFDISRDLSLKVEPAVINSDSSVNPLKSSALGLQCSLNF
ncbi:MAG: DUF5683 domain-containing protein [Prevotella sp.]|nr:DUF5683 domain-containing protein [Prevotella sp.]